MRARSAARTGLAGTLVGAALLVLAVLLGARGEGRPARGAFWSAHDERGELLQLPPGARALTLLPNQELRLQPAPGRRLAGLELRLQKHGRQSSHVDVALHGSAGTLRLRLHPGATALASLTRSAAGGAEGELLAEVEQPGALRDPSAPFVLAVRTEVDRTLVQLDGRDLLQASHGGLAFERAVVRADGALVHELALHGAAASGEPTTTSAPVQRDDLQGQRTAPWVGAAKVLSRLLAALALAAGWLATLAPHRPRPARLLSATLLTAAPPSAVLLLLAALHLLGRPLPGATAAFSVLGVAALVGLLLARPVLAGASPRPGRAGAARARERLTVLVLAASCAVLTSEAVAATLRPRLAEAAAALGDLSAQEVAVDGEQTLHRANALALPQRTRSVQVSATVDLPPGAVLEIRLRGGRPVATGVALLLSAHPDLPCGFEQQGESSRALLGPRAPPLSPGRHTVTVRAEGSRLQARVDERPLAAARADQPAAGSVVLLAAAGTPRVSQLRVTPLPEPPLAGDGLPRARAAGAALAVVLLAALGTARLVGRRFGEVAEGQAFAFVPLGLGLATSAGRGVLSEPAQACRALATAAVLAAWPLARARTTGGARLTAALLLALAAGWAAPRLALGPPSPPGRADLPDPHDLPDARLVPGLVHFQHPLLRQHNTWLADHRFRDRRAPLVPAGRRVLCLGSSSTWGHGIPTHTARDYPALLQRKLGEAAPELSADVVNGAISGSTSARLLHVLREALLDFSPDVVTLSLGFNDANALTIFDELPLYERWSADGAVVDAAERRRVAREVGRGRELLTRLVADPAAAADTAAAWRRLVDDPGRPRPDELFRRNLEAFALLCAEAGVDLVLVVEPLQDGADRFWKDEFAAAMRQVAADHGLSLVDPAPALAAAGGAELFMDLVHPLPAGNEVIAEALLPVVLERLRAREAHRDADDAPAAR